MVTKLVCQLPDVDGFGRKDRLSFDSECVQDLGWTPDDWKFKFNPNHAKYISDTLQKVTTQRSYSIHLRSASVNEVQVEEYTVRPFNAFEYIRHQKLSIYIYVNTIYSLGFT